MKKLDYKKIIATGLTMATLTAGLAGCTNNNKVVIEKNNNIITVTEKKTGHSFYLDCTGYEYLSYKNNSGRTLSFKIVKCEISQDGKNCGFVLENGKICILPIIQTNLFLEEYNSNYAYLDQTQYKLHKTKPINQHELNCEE